MPIVPRFLLVIVSSAAYLGLAILGWGGFVPFFARPALTTLTVALAALAVVSPFAGGSLSPGVREDRGNRWVIAVFAVLGLLNAYLPAYTDRIELWTLDGDSIRWLGVLLFAA